MGRNSSRSFRRTARLVVARDAGICGICSHGGADTADHIVTVRDWPRDAYGQPLPGVDDPDNLQAAHGSRGSERNACYQCDPGRWPDGRLCNQSRGAGRRAERPERHSRMW